MDEQNSLATQMAKQALNKLYDKTSAASKKYLIKFLKWSAPFLIGVTLLFLLMMIIVYSLGAVLGQKNNEDNSSNIPIAPEVEQYTQAITIQATFNNIPDFVNVIKAIIMQESGGRGLDVMQSSECEFNTVYPKKPNSIQNPQYSIEVGVKYFAKALSMAECTSPDEIDKLSLALQGYNFGTGYITWAIANYGGYSKENAVEFSKLQAEKLGWSKYGDTGYVQKVLAYLDKYTNPSSTSGYIKPVPNARVSSPFGWRILNGKTQFHKGVDFASPNGTPILASMEGEVIQSDWSTGGYGYRVKIRHPNGYITHYAHCSKLIVKLGDYVKQGDTIALIGNTGDSYGNHLHWEVISDLGEYLDGEIVLEGVG